jgi:UDP-glucose 4-epimerase
VLHGDVTDAAAVKEGVRGVEGVVHLAGLAHRTESGTALDKEYERVNVGGTAAVVDAALRARVQRVVLFSTIAVYGATGTGPVDERTAPKPDTAYARSKRAAEERLLAASTADGRSLGTVLRMAAVYGGNVTGNYLRLARSLARHRFVPVGDGRNRRTLVYEDDAGIAALLALESPKAGGQVYNVSDGSFHTLREINHAICSALGRRPPRISVPLRPALGAVRAMEGFGRMLALTPPLSVASLLKYSEDVAVEGWRIQRELGFEPRFDLRRGWQAAIEQLRLSGRL